MYNCYPPKLKAWECRELILNILFVAGIVLGILKNIKIDSANSVVYKTLENINKINQYYEE